MAATTATKLTTASPKESRLTSAFQTLDHHSPDEDKKKQALFDAIDSDGSGQISKNEFERMYSSMKSAIEQEHAEQTKVAMSLEAAKKRSRPAWRLSGLLVFVLMFLLVGNMGLMYKVVQLTKESHVVPSEGSAAAMVDRTNAVVATAAYTSSISAHLLPSLGRSFDYTAVESIVLEDEDEDEARGYRIWGYHWMNSTELGRRP